MDSDYSRVNQIDHNEVKSLEQQVMIAVHVFHVEHTVRVECRAGPATISNHQWANIEKQILQYELSRPKLSV